MSNNIQHQHIPVLLEEVIRTLNIQRHATYLDATFGSGGYSTSILKTPTTKVVAFDHDITSRVFYNNLTSDMKRRCILHHQNFTELDTIYTNKHNISGIVFDLGTSTMQLKTPERGFSFLVNGKLDMRMNQNNKISAFTVVNQMKEKQLADIIFKYGNENKSRKIAKAIIEYRKSNVIYNTRELANIITKVIKKRYKIHPATKTFQAIRIYVNNEIESLQIALIKAINIIKKGGTISVVSFHSLEDKITKSIFSSYIPEYFYKYSKKVIQPSHKEIKFNPGARSAKLRAIIKKKDI